MRRQDVRNTTTRLTGRADRRFNAGVDVANPIHDLVFRYLVHDV